MQTVLFAAGMHWHWRVYSTAVLSCVCKHECMPVNACPCAVHFKPFLYTFARIAAAWIGGLACALSLMQLVPHGINASLAHHPCGCVVPKLRSAITPIKSAVGVHALARITTCTARVDVYPGPNFLDWFQTRGTFYTYPYGSCACVTPSLRSDRTDLRSDRNWSVGPHGCIHGCVQPLVQPTGRVVRHP